MSLPALPALTKTYSVRANAPFQDNTSALNLARSMILSLKEHMKNTLAGGTVGGTRHANSVWTVKGSSDGTTAALDNVDRWSTISNLVFNASGSAHSWIVLENATLGYQVCIDCNQLAATNIGFAATEIATPFTGGSSTTRPTATNEFLMGSNSTGAAVNFLFISDVTTGNFNWTHYVTADDGQFFFLVSRTGLGLFPTFMALQKTSNPQPGDTRNIFLIGHSLASARGAPSYAGVVPVSTGCVGRNPNGSVNTLGGIQNAGTFGTTASPGAAGVDALSGNYPTYPCHVSSSGTQRCYRGQLPDLYMVGTAPNTGSVPSTAAQLRVVAGDFIVPFPTVTPIV